MKNGTLAKLYEFEVEVFLEEEMYNEGDIRGFIYIRSKKCGL